MDLKVGNPVNCCRKMIHHLNGHIQPSVKEIRSVLLPSKLSFNPLKTAKSFNKLAMQ